MFACRNRKTLPDDLKTCHNLCHHTVLFTTHSRGVAHTECDSTTLSSERARDLTYQTSRNFVEPLWPKYEKCILKSATSRADIRADQTCNISRRPNLRPSNNTSDASQTELQQRLSPVHFMQYILQTSKLLNFLHIYIKITA